MHNLISHIQNDQGERIETHEGIEENFLRYFKKVHQEPSIDRLPTIEKILQQIPKLIIEEHNLLLLQPILLHEVDSAVKQLKAGKAPGPNGFTSNFFHQFWDLIQIEVWQLVEESHALRWMYPGLNATFMALIPKTAEANKPDKYRPIALCNIIYKIGSKVIATRLKPLLPLIILPEQSGYVEGRQITDGIILTHEIIHSLKQSKRPGMLLKIDLSKAFDTISWQYIQKILNAFGFDPSWTRWILLLTSSFFSVLINGIPYETFRPSRGIRQGDPLSPFLFVIIAKGLDRNIKSSTLSRGLKGLPFNNSPSYSHQQFVDDNMLFGHPSVQEARLFKDILSSFSDASGALINRVKSQIFFFNTPVSTQRLIARILGFTIAGLPSKYLGAPMIASALKHYSWRDLINKLEAKLFLWTHRSLNMANRVILIKAILQSMPLYLFSLLAAPKWVIKEIRNLQRNFLWGSSGHNRKWALVKWEKVCLPKKAGGIGIRDPEHNNIVMGAKLWWRWLAHPNTPWASLWTAKYASNSPIEDRIHMSELSAGSIIWNSVIQHRHLIQQHSFREIKNGDTARFWDDSWQQLPKIKDLMHDLPIPQQGTHPLETVKQFWSSSTTQKHRKWKGIDQIIREEGYEGTKQKLSDELKKRQIPIAAGADILRILTWDNLRKRNFSGPSICPNCKQAEETTTHLLQTCHLGRKLWEKATFRCQRDNRVQGDLKATLRNWQQSPYHSRLLNSLWQLIPGLLMWNIWKERNRRLFKNQSQTLEHIWIILHRNIKESLSIHDWVAEDFATDHKEKSIWDN
eukprot:PITA_09912